MKRSQSIQPTYPEPPAKRRHVLDDPDIETDSQIERAGRSGFTQYSEELDRMLGGPDAVAAAKSLDDPAATPKEAASSSTRQVRRRLSVKSSDPERQHASQVDGAESALPGSQVTQSTQTVNVKVVTVIGLLRAARAAVPDRSQFTKQQVLSESTIVDIVQKEHDMVAAKHPTWSLPVRHLVVGALCVHELRLSDISLREEVLLLEVIEGSRFLRAHDGTAYFYSPRGSFVEYCGLIPQASFDRCKKYLIVLEGLFRAMPANPPRTAAGIMEALGGMFCD